MHATYIVGAALAAAVVVSSCGGDGDSDIPEGAEEAGLFYVIEDDGLEFDELDTVCDAEAIDDATLLAGTPFESRRFPDFTRVFRCTDDARVTAAVVLSSPSFRRYEFLGPPVVEWSPGGERKYSELEIEGMSALMISQAVPDIDGHSAAIYVIEQLPDGDDPGRMAELQFVSPEGAVCFMRQIIDLDPPGPCEN